MKESIKKRINELYGIDMDKDYCGGWTCLPAAELAYCKADAQATFDMYRRKVENNMKDDKKMYNIKLFFNVWCPHDNDVLFILLKDSRHNYYDVTGHKVEPYTNSLRIISPVFEHYEEIPYADIEDWAVGIKNPGESALSAIPEWFEERIDEYTRKLKEEQRMKDRWDLYYTHTESGQDRIIIAKTLEDAKKYAASRYEGYSEPVWLAEADKHDIEVKANRYSPSTLWSSCTDTRLNIPGEVKYADAIAWLKYKLGIAVEPKKTGSIEVRYEDGHTRVFDDVEEYEENYSVLGIHQLYIREADGRQYRFPLVKIKEYVVDMPNDKKLVKEKITVSREEMADIVAKMRELEERLKKIQEG